LKLEDGVEIVESVEKEVNQIGKIL